MKKDSVLTQLKNLSSYIGNTPLLAVYFEYMGEERVIYAKAENLNMTGSIKDRMTFQIIKKGYEEGHLKPDYSIVEVTSGNTGISFSAIGRALGHHVIIYMPDWLSEERKKLIHCLGSEIRLVSREQNGFIGAIQLAQEWAKKNGNAFLPDQFSNRHNIEAHYLTTGPEIWWQLKLRSLRPDAFIAGVGTGGTIMGAGRFLREKNPDIKLYPLEPANSPTLSTGRKFGNHRIQGISDEFIPPILDLASLDKIISVDDGDSIIMAQKLAASLGLGVGISSGANFLGALKVQEELGSDAIVVTVFADDNKKYLSTDLMSQEPVKPDFMSDKVKLLGFKSFQRTCYTCCNPKKCEDAHLAGSICKEPLPVCPRRTK